MKRLLIISTTTAALLSPMAFAQSEGQSQDSVSENLPKKEAQFSVNIEGLPLLLSGFGMNASYKINEHVEAGVFGRTFKMKPNDGLDSFAETKYKISSTGVRGSYFLNSSSGNTPYITAGIGTIKVDADSRISGLSIFPDETRSISESKALFETKAGYQFAGANLSENTKFQIRLGLGYSTGSGFEHKIGQTQLGIKDKLDIKDGMTLEADAGIMF